MASVTLRKRGPGLWSAKVDPKGRGLRPVGKQLKAKDLLRATPSDKDDEWFPKGIDRSRS